MYMLYISGEDRDQPLGIPQFNITSEGYHPVPTNYCSKAYSLEQKIVNRS